MLIIGYYHRNNFISNKLFLNKVGHLTDLEMRSLQLKNSILYDFCQIFRLFASVGFTIDCVTTQHTPIYVENCSNGKLSYICLSNFYQIFYNLGYNSENSGFF